MGDLSLYSYIGECIGCTRACRSGRWLVAGPRPGAPNDDAVVLDTELELGQPLLPNLARPVAYLAEDWGICAVEVKIKLRLPKTA